MKVARALLEFIGGCIYVVLATLWWCAWGYWRDRAEARDRLILELLAESLEPIYGLDLVKQSAGRLARGTVYVLLSRLEDRGLISRTERDADGRRRYLITDAGRKACR